MASDPSPMGPPKTPPERPRWWKWARMSGLGWRELAAAITARGTAVSHQQLWLIGLLLEDRKRAMPSDELKAAIHAYTYGFVNAETDWPPLPPREDAEKAA